jgi:phosphate uptake regulator
MALYMLMGKYSTDAIKAIMESGSDREAVARKAIEAAPGAKRGRS